MSMGYSFQKKKGIFHFLLAKKVKSVYNNRKEQNNQKTAMRNNPEVIKNERQSKKSVQFKQGPGG